MVFESLVADLLNRFLGDFVENLDSSQLNVGIWGGDVRLEDLEVKETALDDFDLPIKLKFGYLSSLVLKIPWKNLYTEPVIADIDGLHLIIVPNKGVVYNEGKAKKNSTEVKQKTLARLEEARKNRRKPADPVQDSFTEKMITQIIKNLQVSIKNIHVRFEDKWTNRHRPFCAGVTLENLIFQTTDENWLPTIRKETVKIIHKLISLENLAVYWNSSAELLSDLDDRDEIKEKMLKTITTGTQRPDNYKYILEPIKMEAKLQLNQKPETDGSGWKIPKIDLSVDMQALALKIGKFQYQDILLFLEAQERFTLAGQYLKYRPHSVNEYRGHYRKWWHFAYTCILEEKVRRRRRNWNWERMKRHRHLVRDYRDAWVKQQTEKSLPGPVTELIKKAEDTLDVFNINVARQQAEMEIDRKGLTRVEDQPQGIMGWAKSWWSSGTKDDKSKNQSKDIVSQFEEAMNPDEKAKLFEAIDYQENIPPTNYPKEYVENKMAFRLGEVAIAVDGAILMRLLELNALIQQRPSAAAINIKSGIKELRMDGGDTEMLRVRDSTKPWLDLEIDTNPIHGSYDQKVRLNIAPVSLKYHAPAVNTAIEVFKPPESVRLNQLTAAAMSRYEDVKTRSVTGLAHAVEFRKKLVLDISINPATLMISEGGIYSPEKPTIVADLGVLSITTVESKSADITGSDRMAQLREQAYDKFRVKLNNVVIAFAENMEKACSALLLTESPLHILKPTGLDIQLHKSSIDDFSLPRIRIVGDLPDVVVVISDQRLLMLMRLLDSIPKPKPEETPEILEDLPLIKNEVKIKDRAKMKTIMEADEVETSEVAQEKAKDDAKNEQQVQVELDLKLETIGVIIFKSDEVLVDVRLQRFVCQLQMRTFDLIVKAELGSISVAMPKFRSLDERKPHLFLVNSFEEEGALMEVKFVQANPESPFFSSDYQKTEMAVVFKFSRLNLGLHQEAFLEVKRFGEALQEEMAKEKPQETENDGTVEAEEQTLEEAGRKLSKRISSSMESLAQMAKESQQGAAQRKRARQKKQEVSDPSIIKMRVDASIGQLAILMGTEKQVDTFMAIETVNSEVKMTEKTMDVKATLQAIKIQDMTKEALYSDLMAVHGNEDVLRFELTQFQRTDAEKKAMIPEDIDMKVKLRVAQMRFVFLQLWVNRMQAFVAPFGAETAKARAHVQAVAAEKGQEALEAAKQLLEQSPPRIELDVELLAPLILVPRLSTSTHVLVVDLGSLTVRNRILGDRQYKRAVLDSMQIKLTDVYFGIGHMDDDAKKLMSKCEILNPITFSLDVHRNLTFGIVKDIPETAVDAHISAIRIRMSHDDYVMIMRTLSGNMSEGKELVEENVAPPPVIVSSDKKEERLAGGADEKTQSKNKFDDRDALKMHVYKKIIFKFVLDNIALELFTGLTLSAVRDLSNAFASMRIEGLKLSGHIKEDNEMEVAMSLDTFKMNDERKDKTKIPQLLDKKPASKEDRFLDLSFKQAANEDKNVRVEMSAFFLCMCPEFLGCLAAFFTVPQTQEDLEREGRPAAVKAPTHLQTDKNIQIQQPQAPPGAITMDCDLKGVEVIIVENSMDPDNTQALIMSFNAKLKAEPRQDEQVMHGGVEAFRVFSSFYASHKRKDVTYEVLKSVDIGIAARINNDTKATDLMLKMTPLEFKMAPSVIRLLAAANAEFARNNQAEQSAMSVLPKRKSYPAYWAKKSIEEHKFWFFNVPDQAQEVNENYYEEDQENHVVPAQIENCTIEIPRLSFTLEAGNEAIPLPLIFFDMQVKADAHNWSSALKANAEFSVQMSYYNEGCSVWEPVIEPIEDIEKPNEWERWSLRVSAEGRNKLDKNDNRAGMSVKVEADKMLNLTVTKSFIQLLTRLGEGFAAAAKQTSPPISRQLPGLSSFLIYNDTGMTVRVANSKTLKASGDGSSIDATHGSYVDVDILAQPKGKEEQENADTYLSLVQEEIKADLRLELLDTVREVVVGRADKWMLTLPKQSEGGKQWKILVDVTIENSRRLITLRSHVQVANHLSVDMEIYSRRDNSLDLAAVVPSNGVVNLPTPLLFTPTGDLFFKPVGEKTEVSFEAVSWHDFGHQKRAPIRCNLSEDDTKGFFFETVVEQENIHFPTHGDVSDMHALDAAFKLSLYPPLVFHNNLPFPVRIEQPTSIELAPGNDSVVNIIPGQNFCLRTQYLGEDYILAMRMEQNHEDLQVVALNTESGSAELLLGLHWSMEYGGLKAYLYAPFWLVNNTSLTLRHMESATGFIATTTKCMPCRHRSNFRENEPASLSHVPSVNPIILPFPSKDVGQKKKSRVQIDESSAWSDEFPLDTVGNTARVICKGAQRDFDLSVSINLCQSGLTKIVSFAPFYLMSNCGKFDLEVREDSCAEWTRIPAETCIGVWPSQRSQRKFYCARFADSTEESLLFPVTENIETLAQINDDSAGIDVACRVGEASVTVHLTPFTPGSAPVHLINHLKIPIHYGQKGHSKAILGPKEHIFYTWSDLTRDRVLEYQIGDYKSETKLEQNEFGEAQPRKDVRKFIYHACFLSGRQRTLLFTADSQISRLAFGAHELEAPEFSFEVFLQGIGLSVVDNEKGMEVLFIGISSSDILWEEEVRSSSIFRFKQVERYKPLPVKYMQRLEDKYQHYLLTKESDWEDLEKYEFHLKHMLLRKKKNGKEIKMRRTFERGLWAHYTTTAMRKRLHFKLNHLQVDNQMDACVFPCVLSIVPPPKSVIQDNAPKPFIEISFVERASEFSTIPEVEYSKVLVQEFAVRVDQGLINACMALSPNAAAKKPYGKAMFDEDLQSTQVNLSEMADAWKSQKPKSYYDDFHISPLMIHLSFSQGGTTAEQANAPAPIQSEFIQVLLKSVGVTLTELQDVVFKLAYFERKAVFYNLDQLNAEIVSHYTMQAIKQLYVLVLGLDIIGNPFGLVRDLSTGVEDLFYQPYQGLIQGPEEFVSGVAIGVQSMFGHAVGGAAGAVGRITGTVGKGVAALTFDQEYQRKRQEDLNRRPQSFAEGMARGLKGLGMGVVDGVKGVVTKPIEGAKQDGFGGFIKGTGKGLVGLAARPISGVVDFASSSMDAVRSVAGTHKDTGAIRPPRYIKPDHIVRPYSPNLAMGYRIFKDTDRGAYTETDHYICYAPISERIVLLVTSRRLIIAKRTDVMGTWTADWTAEFTKIHPPQYVADGVKIRLLEKKRGFLGLGGSEGKIITFENAQVRRGLEGIQQSVMEAYHNATGK